MTRRKFWFGTTLFFVILALVTISVFFGSCRLLRGAWIDRSLSAFLSRQTGLKIRFYDVMFSERKLAIRFGIFSVLDPKENKVLFVAGSGRAVVLPNSFPGGPAKRYKVQLQDVAIMEDLCRKSPIIDWASKQAFQSPISLQSADIVLKRSGRRTVARVISCRSEHVLIKGGVALDGTRIIKAHLLVLLPEEKFEKVPKEMRARMIRRKGGWRGVRLLYHNNVFTAAGDSGPFFQAQWDGSTSSPS